MARDAFIATQPYSKALAVTPSDSTALSYGTTDAIYVGGAGNVAVLTANGDNVTLVNMLAGTGLEICVSKVLNTGTTATNIVALYR